MGNRFSGPRTIRAAFTAAILVIGLAGCELPQPAAIPVSPGVRGSDVAGNDGPCGSTRTEVFNPQQWELPTFVFEPTGCAGARPVIFFGHGYTASFTEAYRQFIDHLVSRGYVVVYPGYQLEFDPPKQYAAMDGGFVAGIASLPADRVDLSRIGFIGHSFGAGMIPRMMQLADGRGWGATAMWAVSLSPAWSFLVGDGPIAVPSHARVLTISYEDDFFVDTQIATEMLRALTIPDANKQQLLIHRSWPYASDHLLPLTLPLPISADHMDRWATWRPIDAWAGCTLSGVWCDLDLADMGPGVARATIGLGVPDIGPPAIVECESIMSPRRCWP